MNPKALVAIANYIERIYRDVIWPVLIGSPGKAANPARLAAVVEFLNRANAEPIRMWGRNCTRDEDCGPTEECNAEDRTCQSIGGPHMDYLSAEQLPEINDGVQKAIEDRFTQYYQTLSRALAEDPRRLASVRFVLMRAYIAAQKVACVMPEACAAGCVCPAGKECVDGICVPIPFNVQLMPQCATPTRPWV